MYWWKSDQHSCRNRDWVYRVWCFSPKWSKWSDCQEHGTPSPEQSKTNQHRNPPGVANWKRQAASHLGNSCWGPTWHWTVHSCWSDWGCQMSAGPVSRGPKLVNFWCSSSHTKVVPSVLLDIRWEVCTCTLSFLFHYTLENHFVYSFCYFVVTDYTHYPHTIMSLVIFCIVYYW